MIRLQERRRLADPEALREAVAQPLDARDVALVVAALAPGGATGPEDAVAALPLPQRVGADAGAMGDGRDVEPGAGLLRGGASLEIGADRRREVLQDADVSSAHFRGVVSIAQSVPIVRPPSPSSGTPR